jgi:hydrogenase maturation protease
VRTVVFGVGNAARGDDALGPLLLARIAEAFPAVTALAEFQLQIEHALDLEGAGLVLFVDADAALEGLFAFREIGPGVERAPFTHALRPEAVLEVFERIEGRAPPPSFVLALRGERFGLGEPLSPGGRAALDAAWAFLAPLLETPALDRWCEAARHTAGRMQRCAS